MTTSELVLQTLSCHHEQSVGQLYKKLAGQPGINNSKSVSNALMRLKKDGRVTNTFDADRAIWLWRTVKEGETAPQSECPPNHSEYDLEMANDAAELEQPTVQESLTDAVTTSNVVNHDAECRAKPRKPYAPNKIVGAYAYRGALVIKLDRKANAKSITLSAKDMAMLTSIFGGTA